MNTKQLIKKLQTMPQNAMVVVDGYEEGVSQDIKTKVIHVTLNRHGWEDGIYARHAPCKKGDGPEVVYIGTERLSRLNRGW